MHRKLVPFPLTEDDLLRLFGPSNDLTITSWDERWLYNVELNLKRYPQPRPAAALLYDVPNYHTLLVCGAGWTLRKLKPYAHMIPPSWGIVCADRAVSFVIDCGLTPSLVVTMDGDQTEEPIMHEAFRKLRWVFRRTPVPVLADLVCCPTITHQLDNPFWFRSMTPDRALAMRYLRQWEVDTKQGIDYIGHGGNVGSVCTIAAKYFLYARHIVLIGFNFSMCEGTRDVDTWEHRTLTDKHQYIDVCDIYGRPVRTIANLHNYRVWQEAFIRDNPDVEWINANDGGYLGVHDPTSNYDHYTYETLPQAIKRLGEHGLEDH